MNKQIETKEELIEFLKNADIDWVAFKYEDNFNKEKNTYDLHNKETDEPIDVDLGTINHVDQYGGEGQGDDYWVVAYFEKYDAYVRIDGYYASYDGGYLDGEPRLVTPKQKTITVYE